MTARAMGVSQEAPPSSYRHIGWGSLVGSLLAVSIAQAQIAPPIFDPSGRSSCRPLPCRPRNRPSSDWARSGCS
ncbi:protein of unknown function [Nitrospira japonica]|uniref:Uncharacterized protein n=1 Tax=Nitrospira japonica TaxID=1325564 RepID=A0A1W1I7Y4_9BACT|nr:protein of unknown function [Nitrospira japonica]